MIQLGENPWVLIILSTLEILFIIVPSLISSWISRTNMKQELHQIGVELSFSNLINKLIKVVLGIFIGIGLVLLSILILFFFRDIITIYVFSEEFVSEGTENAISTQLLNPTPLQFFIFVLIQFLIIGPCEESFFRGFIILKLKPKMPLFYAIVISSVFFALFHVPPFLVPISTIISYFGYYFTIGFILALVFTYSNFSLIPGSLAHSVFNFLILLL
ncbi:MAG: CPBP family intramembrane metalloprotease [Promethearchaeota archaeon]|nr:MAG: CPBP family intramembrane metalloprotease [Candidatus Lokiarchaeota archaeon]